MKHTTMASYITPKSMNQSRIWSPEGKAAKVENRNWCIKSKREREGEVKQWISKGDEFRKSFIRRINTTLNNKTK